MCGIVAVLGDAQEGPGMALLDRIRHRGPDGSGFRRFDGCFLAMARLAILDPTKRADQPMSWQGRHLVYNGEVYNFAALRHELSTVGVPFSTTGDTEVVLKALVHWGTSALDRFAGMFALALWDEHSHTLTVARDEEGIKPLYWRPLTGGGVAIASEATPLAAMAPAPPRLAAVREFLRVGAPVSACIYDDVVEVAPGSVITWSRDGSCTTTTLQCLPAAGQEGSALLRAVTGEHLVSDRPVAIFLSGGFDSAAVAAAMTSAGTSPVAITLKTDDNGQDVARALATAARYRLESRVLDVSFAEAKEVLTGFLAALDQPTIDGFNTYLVSRAAVDAGFPVALSGLGGDEVLGGYGYHRWQRHVDIASAVWVRAPTAARRAMARAGAHAFHRRAIDVSAILSASSLGERHLAWRSIFNSDEVRRLTGADAEAGLPWVSDAGESARSQLQGLDRRTYLQPTLLRDTDVFSMANSVEVRVPLLDRRFVNAVRSNPRINGKAGLARELGDEHLSALAAKPKLTFSLPWHRWIVSVLLDHRELLAETDPWRGLVDPCEARRILADPATGHPLDALRSWALLILAVWLARPPAARRLPGRRA